MGSKDGDFVCHFMAVGTVEDTVDFGFKKFIVELIRKCGFLGDERFISTFLFVRVSCFKMGGKVTGGAF